MTPRSDRRLIKAWAAASCMNVWLSVGILWNPYSGKNYPTRKRHFQTIILFFFFPIQKNIENAEKSSSSDVKERHQKVLSQLHKWNRPRVQGQWKTCKAWWDTWRHVTTCEWWRGSEQHGCSGETEDVVQEEQTVFITSMKSVQRRMSVMLLNFCTVLLCQPGQLIYPH